MNTPRKRPTGAAAHRLPAVRQRVAPMHRGPQAATLAPVAMPQPFPQTQFHHAPNAALLIDFDNVTMGIRSDLGHELRNLLSSDIIKGKVAVQRAYADWRRYPQYIVPLAESSIDMIMAPAYGSSKKNATDIRLAVDAIELVFTRPEIGTYILLSGDSDFASLVTKLKEYGKYVIGVGIRESSSDLLVMNCDEYYSYNALAGLVKSGDEETTKRDPWELVVEAVARMKRNGDVMRSDRLKQVMQEIDNSFDESDLGMAKFSRFCQEAEKRGLLRITKLENGQMEVDVADGAPAPRAATPNVIPAGERRADEAPRSRRGRRGGRGRRRASGETEEQPELVAELPDIAEFAPSPNTGEPELDFESPVTDHLSPATESDGPRLSRDEAFALIRRALESVSHGPDRPVAAAKLRAVARDLLGRDSESLGDRHFHRILRDMHDAELLDLRKRGDDYEVSASADAPAIADQLAAVEAEHAEASQAARAASNANSLRRGLRGRGRGRGAGELPPDLLSVGVVDDGANLALESVEERETELPLDGGDEDTEGDAGLETAAPADKPPRRRARGVRGGRGRKRPGA